MIYDTLKIIHFISAGLLIGTSIGNLFFAYQLKTLTDDPAQRLRLNLLVINSLILGIVTLLQPITGFLMVMNHAADFPAFWVAEAFGAFGVVLFSALPLYFLLWKGFRPSQEAVRTASWKKGLLISSAICLLGVWWAIWRMTNPPWGY